ncbi:MAG: GntR family transcriptional regulator [Pseudomonadota bacterium]
MTNDAKKLSNTSRAVADLRALIFAGELPAGSDHLESELALRLGMSRTPVREAALLLESQGLVALRPRKGVRILPVSADDMREIYDVLTELESLAAAKAAERKPSAEALAPLARSLARMEAALVANRLEDWAEADDTFHLELVRLSGNSRVAAIAGLMSDQVRRARAVTLYIRPRPERSNQDHRAVLDAIKAGDAARASALHRAHRQRAKDMLVALLERYRLSQL